MMVLCRFKHTDGMLGEILKKWRLIRGNIFSFRNFGQLLTLSFDRLALKMGISTQDMKEFS